MHDTHVTIKIPEREWTVISEWSCKYQVRSPQAIYITATDDTPTGDPSQLDGDPSPSFEIQPKGVFDFQKHNSDRLWGWSLHGTAFVVIARNPNTEVGDRGEAVNKFGYNFNISQGNLPQDIWTPGGLYPYTVFQTAQTIEIVSSSANDAPGGTGMRAVLVQGVCGSNGCSREELVLLNGLTPVTLPGTWLAINRQINAESGSTGANEGNIHCQVAGGGTVVSEVYPLAGQTQQCPYRSPINQGLSIVGATAFLRGSINGSVLVDAISVAPDCVTYRTRGSGVASLSQKAGREVRVGGGPVEPLGWFTLRAITADANNIEIAGEWDGVVFGDGSCI